MLERKNMTKIWETEVDIHTEGSKKDVRKGDKNNENLDRMMTNSPAKFTEKMEL